MTSMKRPARIEEEFSGSPLGDARLDSRVRKIATRMAAAPADSFPEQMRSTAEREALYRFLGNESVTLDALLRGHVRKTHERIASHPVVRIVHDTTDFKFEGEREGLGVLKRGARGFFAHMALAVVGDEGREALGVLAVRPHVLAVDEVIKGRAITRSKRAQQSASKPRDEKLSSRWEKLAIEVAKELPEGVKAVHVMDQEADDYALLAELHRAKLSFVVRGDANRRLAKGGKTVAEALSIQPAHDFRTVRLSRRVARQATKQHAERVERDAVLEIRWAAVTIRPTSKVQSDVKELPLYAVHVFEPNPPADDAPVNWMLFTSEPVDSIETATAIVDHYRARWVIEEFFKALKTGCAFEKRQLMTLDALLRALGVTIPIAWTLLTLRDLGRAPKQRPASTLFDAEQLLLLRAMAGERKHKLPDAPTIRDAMLAIAALGGHIKQNGDPGWIVLGRGMMKFTEAQTWWRLGRRSDQS